MKIANVGQAERAIRAAVPNLAASGGGASLSAAANPVPSLAPVISTLGPFVVTPPTVVVALSTDRRFAKGYRSAGVRHSP